MYRLPETLRRELARPLGPVLPDADGAAAAGKHAVVVAVGDVTTERLLAHGVRLRVAVVDHKTKRTDETAATRALVDDLAERGAPVVRVANPPAAITEDLWDALARALADPADGRTTVIEVDGEEDLATLPAVLLAPDGAAVCYGQPNEGMVVVTVDAALRARARAWLDRMDT